jgi:two-component system response regulator HydG
MIAEKRFRQDLYYRLNVARFMLPPLRERREDIPSLAEFFIDKFRRKMGVKARFGDGVLDTMMQLDFPGNIRELENMVEQAVALAGDGNINRDDLPLPMQPATSAGGSAKTLADVVDVAERQAIENALREAEGSRERAADLLGISPTTLWRKMTRFNITY